MLVSGKVHVPVGAFGMMISRRPNSRASSEKAPAPRQMTAAAIAVARAAAVVVSNNATLGAGSQEHMVLTPATNATRAAKRVR